jgi:hypothetical protein
VEQAIKAGRGLQTPPLVRVPRVRRMPLSFAQQRLWFMEQLEPNNLLYNCPGAVRLEGKLDLGALERVINEVVRRHEILRTRIEVEEGVPAQVIDEWEPLGLEVEDLTSLTHEESEETVRRIARAEAETGFDLSRGPLLRVKLLKLEEEQHVALFTMHHIVSDGWSLGVLVREVCDLYAAMSEGKGSPLPELEIQYADYATWQRQYLTGAMLEKRLAYWKKQLGGKLPPLDLPTDHLRPPVSGHRGASKSFLLPVELCRSLRELSRQEGVTLFMTLLAAFKTLLYRYTAQEDIIIGAAVANRNRAEIEPLIGFFVNMLPMRTDLSGNPRFTELLRRVKETALDGYAYQDIPFEKLVEEIRPERLARQMPLFNVAFGVQNAPRENLTLKDIQVRPMVAAQEGARLDLTLWITESAEGMGCRWTYSKDLFEDGTILRMQTHFETLLFNIIDRPDARLTTLEISSRPEIGLSHQRQGDRRDPDIGRLTSIKRRGVTLSTEPV